MRSRAEPFARWAPVVLWMALIFILSAQPGLAVSADPSFDLPVRRAAHVGAYGILTVLVAHALSGSSDPRRLILAGAVAVVYGVTDELHQSVVPDRTGQAEDVLLDALGAALAMGTIALHRRVVARH